MGGTESNSDLQHPSAPSSADGTAPLLLATGTRVGQNVILEEKIGEGGMGEVWKGTHESLNRPVAVKIILPGSLLDKGKNLLERFEREARAAAALDSPHIVHVYDLGYLDEDRTTPYIVMEFLRGESLGEHLKRTQSLNLAMTVTILSQVGKALAHAHARGVIHRDIKPDNLFLVQQDDGEIFVKVVDFGIAKQVDATEAQHLTQTGVVLGTPSMMSPEQLMSAQNVTKQADHWALACVAYWCLTGQLPFQGDTITSLIVAITKIQYTPPSQLGLPAVLDGWFARAFHLDRAQRFESMKEYQAHFAKACSDAHNLMNPNWPSGPGSSDPAIPTSSLPTPPTVAQHPAHRPLLHTERATPLPGVTPPGHSFNPNVASAPSKKPMSFGRFMVIIVLVFAVPGLAASAIKSMIDARATVEIEQDEDDDDASAEEPPNDETPRDAPAIDTPNMDKLFDVLLRGSDSSDSSDPSDAIDTTRYTKDCDGGNASACTNLGVVYEKGDGVKKSARLAVTYYERACDGGDMRGCAYLGFNCEKGEGTAKDVKRANTLYDKACRGGFALGCALLGLNYEAGTGVNKDLPRANELYKKACDGNDPKGCRFLGVNYFTGNGVAKDAAKASRLFDTSCKGGDMKACRILGLSYEQGKGVNKDLRRANELYKKACDEDDPRGCRFLGVNYFKGNGTTKDAAKASRLFDKSCRGGDMTGCRMLGLSYEEGKGVNKDLRRANELYKKACDGDDARGCTWLGVNYKNGTGVSKDLSRAGALYEKGCNGGYKKACDLLRRLRKK